MAWATTSWTQVFAARGGATTDSRRALETLCRTYWYPLYAFVSSQGLDPDDARDVTQAYFAELLEKGYLEDCDPSRHAICSTKCRTAAGYTCDLSSTGTLPRVSSSATGPTGCPWGSR